jgi:hypothetical protein
MTVQSKQAVGIHESPGGSHTLHSLGLSQRQRNILFAGQRLHCAPLDDVDDFWLAVGVDLLVGNGLDEFAVVLEDGVHLVLELG